MTIINSEIRAKLDTIVARYPEDRRQAALIPALHVVQKAHGCLDTAAQQEIADYTGISLARVQEVVTFYTMLSEKPRGRYHLQMCRTICCAVTGAEPVIDAVVKRLGIAEGEVTEDGLFSYEKVECLAQCHLGPVIQIDEDVYGNMTAQKAVALIDDLAAGK